MTATIMVTALSGGLDTTRNGTLPMTTVSTTANSLLKRLSRGMQALLLSVVGLGATVLLWAATLITSVTWKEFLNAIATGLLVSAAFGMAQALITSRVATEMLRTSVVEEVNRSLAQSSHSFYPISEFPASSAPNPQFNFELMQDLANSSTFWFRGMSGRFTAARLALNQNVSLQAHLVLPDPLTPGTLEGRIDYAIRHEIYPDKTIEEIRAKIRSDFKVGLVGLFEAAHKCAILELVLTPMPLLDRYEIFRDAIWVTLFSYPGRGTKHPRTLRFSSASVMYMMQQADCLQTRNHPSARLIQFPRSISEADMFAMFKDITGDEMPREEYVTLKGEFNTFLDSFIKDAGIKRG